ncbi:MAG: hypothetical protein JST66_16840 [Bacteroidetes bacterium]|nr:hypothetical protein [Bacteroidota bacterium]
MKLFLSILLAALPVVAAASLAFMNFQGPGFKWVRPDPAAAVAFWIVVGGASIQVSKDVFEWREDRKQKKAEEEAIATAGVTARMGLEGICRDVGFMLQWMAAESRIIYPCPEQNELPNWLLVHYGYRSGIIDYWTNRRAEMLAHTDASQWRQLLSIMDSWRQTLDFELAGMDLDNAQLQDERGTLNIIKRQVDSNWGINDLSEGERSNPTILMQQVRSSLQQVVNQVEMIYPTLMREKYSEGRKACAMRQQQLYPQFEPYGAIFQAQVPSDQGH